MQPQPIEISGISTTLSTRDANLYFGQTTNVYCVPNEFDYRSNSLTFNFDAWASVESFESGVDGIPRLRKTFEIKGEEFESVKTENAEMLTSIENIALDLLRVGGRGYKLERLFLTAIGKFMVMSASSPDGEHKPDDRFYGSRHDQIIAENLQTIAQATVFMISYGKAHDEFLNMMIGG